MMRSGLEELPYYIGNYKRMGIESDENYDTMKEKYIS